MSFLCVRNLSLDYLLKNQHQEQCAALRDVSFEVKKGEFVCLLGPNGSGKTSLLRSIAGFERPHSGELQVAERTLLSPSVFVPAHKRKVGMVFQGLALFPHLTVRGNVEFGLWGHSRKDREKHACKMMDLCGLSAVHNHYCYELSGGLQQRLAIARALAPAPEILLLDEPFSSLDPSITVSLVQDVRQLLTELGTTTIMVSHNQSQAFEIADRVGVMLDGEIRQYGRPSVVYQTPVDYAVAAFLGNRSFIRCFPSDGGVMSPFGSISPSYMHTATQRHPVSQNTDLALAVRADAIEFVREDLSQSSLPFQVVSQTFQGYYTAVKAKISTGEVLEFWVDPGDSSRLQGGKIRLKNTPHCVYERPACV